MQHLDDGIIQEILDGEIPSRDLGPLQIHLSACDACRARLDAARMAASEADELLTMLDEMAPAVPVAAPVVLPFKRPHWSRNLAWAASLALAVGLGYASRDVLNPAVPTMTELQRATGDGQQATGDTGRVLRDGELGESVTDAATTQAAPSESPASRATSPGATAVPPAVSAATPDARRDQPPPPAPALSPGRDQALSPAAPTALGGGVAASAEGARQTTLSAAGLESARERRAEATPQAAFGRSSANRAVSPALADAAKAMVAAREVDLSTAMRLLGGSIKLIDGMVPHRLDAAGDEVMVVYQVFWGELLLSQHREGSRLEWNLSGPPGFPADSLAVLRGKVKP